ncbi:MAG: hypothetical protein DCF25_13630 [Leptolyngbya foveolarum]|uniref:Uncharacterized protein n=1 Tax=Leptolyngbya foveolarum TaxID=47253 RepID=A0A2W4VSU4_9CYAN|nr:MAG: hypothetical protein DCF25_13630 [Leptolyngbya foveolarum]
MSAKRFSPIYQFQHKTLGQLVRIVLQDDSNGLCQISSEVASDLNDPMTQTRAQIFEPLSQQLSAALEAAIGKGRQAGTGQPNTKVSPFLPKETIASKQLVAGFPCWVNLSGSL